MRICDRCKEPATDQMILVADDHRKDLCETCKGFVLAALQPAKPTVAQKVRGRFKKDSQ